MYCYMYLSIGTVEASQLVSMIKGIFAIEKLKSSRPPRKDNKAIIIEELEKQLKVCIFLYICIDTCMIWYGYTFKIKSHEHRKIFEKLQKEDTKFKIAKIQNIKNN